MSTIQLHALFNNNFYEIPKYQRGYAWDVSNVRELFDDIKESIEANANHYVGTIVLASGPSSQEFFIVDGQQRITTITLVINELIRHLSPEDKVFYRRFFIVENGRYRMIPQNRDKEYFRQILDDDSEISPKNKSQRRLRDAASEIKTLVSRIDDKPAFLNRVRALEVMQFIENSQGNAIRIFQTVNDRGKLLTSLEKVKSLLIYYSNRYVSMELDSYINDSFSDILEFYDDIKQIGEDIDVTLINAKDFNEDNLLRYHFVTFSLEDLDPTSDVVLQSLKNALISRRQLPNTESVEQIRLFTKSYVSGLHEFFKNCHELLQRAKTDTKYYKLFAVLNFSARLYPLIVRLHSMGLLDEKTGNGKETILDVIEGIDVRVYKTRGTDPKAEITRFVHGMAAREKDEIISWLKNFNRSWMPSDLFKNFMKSKVYGNRAVIFIFFNYCEYLSGSQLTIEELKILMEKKPTQEHILAQVPNFEPTALGFTDTEDYSQHEGKFGNLTILESSYNSGIRNKTAPQKVATYDQSAFVMTKQLASKIAMEKEFTKETILSRSEELAEYVVKTWDC